MVATIPAPPAYNDAVRSHADENAPLDPRLLKWMEDRNRFAEQNEDGVDLSLIESNLRLTPDERIRQNFEHAQRVLFLHRNARRVG